MLGDAQQRMGVLAREAHGHTTRPLRASPTLKLLYPRPQLAQLLPQLGYFLDQLAHIPRWLQPTCQRSRVGRQERCLALMADYKSIVCQLGDSRADHSRRRAVLTLKLRQGRELPALGELTGRDPLSQTLCHLLIRVLAGPVDHRHPMPP